MIDRKVLTLWIVSMSLGLLAVPAVAGDTVIDVPRFEGGVQVSSGTIPNCCSSHSMSSINAIQLSMKGCTTMGGYCMGSRHYAYVSFDLSWIPEGVTIESIRLVGSRNVPRTAGGSVCVGFMPYGEMGSSMFNACNMGSTTFNWTNAQNFSINLNPDHFNDPSRDRFAVVRLTQSGENGSYVRNGKTNAPRLSVTLAVPPCVGDLNDNGVVNSADLGFLIAGWGSGDRDADLNGDGVVDSEDLGLMLSNWGSCPGP